MERKKDPVFKRTEESYAKNRIFMREYNQTDAAKESKRKYLEQVKCIRLSLHAVNDADILAALDPERPIGSQIKELVRLALKARDMFQ